MIAVVTILCAFPLGYFLRSHLAANTTYAIAYLWAFVFQTLYLTLDALEGNSKNPAFEPTEVPWEYGLVAALIFGAGFALVAFGRRVRQGRIASDVAPVESVTGR
jgi:hypothetical protein